MGLIRLFSSSPHVVIFLPLVYCGDGSVTPEAICIFPTSAVNAFWQEVSLKITWRPPGIVKKFFVYA